MNIPLRVKNLVKKYHTGDPFQLAGDLDITIVRLPLPDDMRGFLLTYRAKERSTAMKQPVWIVENVKYTLLIHLHERRTTYL